MKPMKTRFTLLLIGSSLLVVSALLAQDNFATNVSTNLGANLATSAATNISTSSSVVTNAPTRKHPSAFTGEQLLLPPALKAKLKLTDIQSSELKPIEDDFAITSQEYKTANQPRIEAANEAHQQARALKDKGQIQATRTQLQQVWAGLQPYRLAAVAKVKPLLTPDQLKILDDPKSQWRENLAEEANDLSVK